jgi:hypothetical protein
VCTGKFDLKAVADSTKLRKYDYTLELNALFNWVNFDGGKRLCVPSKLKERINHIHSKSKTLGQFNFKEKMVH